MTTFAESLRDYLARVERGQAHALDVTVDEARHWAHFLSCLEAHASDDRASSMFSEWSRPRVGRFASLVAREASGAFRYDASHPELASFVDLAIELLTRRQVDGLSAIRLLELRRIVVAAKESSRSDQESDVARYAFEVRLTRHELDRVMVTRAGRTWLRTPGADGLALLLALEASQSTGPYDKFRVSPRSLQNIIASHNAWFVADADDLPASDETLQRLTRLQLMALETPRNSDGGFEPESQLLVTELGKRVFAEVVNGNAGPWNLVAAALTDEERGESAASLVPAFESAQRRRLVEAGARDARLIAHEVRNAVAPVRVQLDRLYTALARERPAFDLSPFRDSIDRGIKRVFEFVDARLRVAAATEESEEAIDVASALEDAVGSNQRVTLTQARESAFARGPRSNFIAVLQELIRNAERAADHVGVWVELNVRDEAIEILFDDDGPGVSPDVAPLIFDLGFSMRGGSGQGLAIAKDVIENAMGGTICLTKSPRGGARFCIVLHRIARTVSQ